MAQNDVQQQQQQQQAHILQQKQQGTNPKAAVLSELLSWSTLLDMFTGRYIYNYCTGRGTSVVKAC